MSGKITGRVEVWANEIMLLNKAGAVASGLGLSGEMAFERKEVMGDTGLHGFVEEPVPAVCEVTISDTADQKLDALARINGDGTIVFKAAGAGGGKTYTMTKATCTSNFSLTAGEGEVPIKFVGHYWTESKQ